MLLIKETNAELLKRYNEGELNLKDKIFQNNISLVYSLINRYKHTNTDRDDLFQIGAIGLLKAIDNFDPSFNVQFSTYAVPLILGEIKKHFRDSGLIKVSRSLKELSIAINKEKNEHYTKNGQDISLEDLSSKLNVSKYEIIMAMETSYLPSSMEETIYEKGDTPITLEETIKDDSQKNIIDLLTLKDGLKLLSEKEKLFVKLRYYKDFNQQTIANKFNISQVQVSRLEKKIIDKLKKCF
jgi:RNA polymerase sporulation-specific sigma factor